MRGAGRPACGGSPLSQKQLQKAGRETGCATPPRAGRGASSHAIRRCLQQFRSRGKKRHDSSKENGQEMISGNAESLMCQSPSIIGPLHSSPASPRKPPAPELVVGVRSCCSPESLCPLSPMQVVLSQVQVIPS